MQMRIFSPNFTRLFYVPTYSGLQIFIQLSATLTKLRHIKRDLDLARLMVDVSSAETHAGWSHLI